MELRGVLEPAERTDAEGGSLNGKSERSSRIAYLPVICTAMLPDIYK
jgi:hypothetical protein